MWSWVSTTPIRNIAEVFDEFFKLAGENAFLRLENAFLCEASNWEIIKIRVQNGENNNAQA